MASPSAHVVDADDRNFEALAIEGSHARPVVVDFWAPWCGPCRVLGPLLESLAEEYAGAFTLVKVDTESAPRTAQEWNIRSIPAVVALRNGEVVAEFVGAQPEAAVRQFLSGVIPSAADEQVEAAMQLASRGLAGEAEQAFRAALDCEAGHPAASLGLGHLLLTRGDLDAARAAAEGARMGTPLDGEIERLQTAIRVRSAGGADASEAKARLERAPDDPAAHLAYGHALAAEGRHEEALAAFLGSLRLDPHFQDEAARNAMLEVFEILGSDHDLTRDFRARLARLLYR